MHMRIQVRQQSSGAGVEGRAAMRWMPTERQLEEHGLQGTSSQKQKYSPRLCSWLLFFKSHLENKKSTAESLWREFVLAARRFVCDQAINSVVNLTCSIGVLYQAWTGVLAFVTVLQTSWLGYPCFFCWLCFLLRLSRRRLVCDQAATWRYAAGCSNFQKCCFSSL